MSTPPVSVRLAGSLGAFTLAAAFDVPARGVTALFGPSGSGKTTILRAIAGLVRLEGHVRIAGETWQQSDIGLFLPPHRREVGYVFQEASLFPHLTVRDNLLFGARRASGEAAGKGPDLAAIVALLGIRGLLDRATTALSGGERQRVAVGRALLSAPRILLMDEPLSALDRPSRLEILPYLERLHEALAIPVLYVSHDLGEVERLADALVLLDRGEVTASGPIAALQTDPRLSLVASAEASVVVEGRIIDYDEGFQLTRFCVPGAVIVAPGLHGNAGKLRRLRIAASDVSIARSAPVDSTILNCLPARIVLVTATNDSPQASVLLALGADGAGCRIVARITRKSLEHLGLRPGCPVYAQVKGVALVATRTRHA